MAQRRRTLCDEEKLFELAARLLSLRARSRDDLRRKLMPCAARPEDVDAVLARLTSAGLLNDEAFAEAFARARRDNQAFGKARVLAELRRARVSPTVARNAVARAYQDADEMALIEQFLQKRFRSAPPGWTDDPKQVAAAFRHLRRAGFSASLAAVALRRLSRQTELLEALESEPPAEDPDSGTF